MIKTSLSLKHFQYFNGYFFKLLVFILILSLIPVNYVDANPGAKTSHSDPYLLINPTNAEEFESVKQQSGLATRSIGCDPQALIDAINTANVNNGPDAIDLPGNCVIEIATFDNFNKNYEYNGFPIISSEITINGNGAVLKSLVDNMRAFEISAQGSLFINNVEIQNFTNENEGGAILNYGTITVSDSTFFSNTGIKGGSIQNLGEATIFNSTFSENRACCCLIKGADGGAIYNTGTLNIFNTTFVDNSANSNGETFYNAGGSIVLKNSIITSDAFGANCSGDPISDGSGNLRWPEYDNSCVGAHGDPKLAPLSLNGGLTRTHALQPSSAAINTGIDSICFANPVNNRSQNGITRPYGPQCDIGSYERDYLLVSAISRDGPNPTNFDTVSYNVAFSKPVTGVDRSDFALEKSGARGAIITSVEGSGANYAVSINTGINSGSIKLILFDDDTIRDLEGGYLGTAGFGNGDFYAGETYIIDKVNPTVVSINRGNSNPIIATSVDFIVKFSEPVSGVTLDDFHLIATDLINPAITYLGGSDDTYIVSVDTGIGSGTLKVDFVDNDNIFDAALNPLGGEGSGNANFTNGQSYTILANATFEDVSIDYWAFTYIEELYDFGITMGCSQNPLEYCPEQIVTRAEMAVFLERSKGTFSPQKGSGTVFDDVSSDDWFVDWVELLYEDEITTGCGDNPLRYCPNKSVTRAEMAVFLLRTKYGPEYEPPKAAGIFDDVNPEHYWAADYIEQLFHKGISTGCAPGLYCPETPVTRDQMAAFLMRVLDLDD